jgi:hypothetical protein
MAGSSREKASWPDTRFTQTRLQHPQRHPLLPHRPRQAADHEPLARNDKLRLTLLLILLGSDWIGSKDRIGSKDWIGSKDRIGLEGPAPSSLRLTRDLVLLSASGLEAAPPAAAWGQRLPGRAPLR